MVQVLAGVQRCAVLQVLTTSHKRGPGWQCTMPAITVACQAMPRVLVVIRQ